MTKESKNRPSGYAHRINAIIEQALEFAGQEYGSSEGEPNVWNLKRGSAKVELVFHPKRGIIYADAYLAVIPEGDSTDIYRYLLKENLFLNDISLSIKENNIIISFLTNDRDLSSTYLSKMIKKLLVAADKYDNILVEKFNARWSK
ncbi:MAG: hypothetical protein KDC49_00955 [Saprospiraceae bacterium]|nr:hypothetical protein [Saprospiraceae bacterium]